MTKHMRDGKVAVLYSPGFGAGWSTWADDKEAQLLLFDPHIAEILEEYPENCEERHDRINQIFALKGYESYPGGQEQLTICWLEPGTVFRVHEYDGSESIVLQQDDDWQVA